MPNRCIDAMIGLTKNPLHGGLASIPAAKAASLEIGLYATARRTL
jgi:hypothetical protein